MTIREYQPEDYPTLAHWWQRRGGVLMPEARLAKIGRVAERDGALLACGFLYLDATGSGMAWPAWLGTNPNARPITAGRALRHVLRCLEQIAEALDYGCAVQTLAGSSLRRFMAADGYQEGDTGLAHLFKNLTPNATA